MDSPEKVEIEGDGKRLLQSAQQATERFNTYLQGLADALGIDLDDYELAGSTLVHKKLSSGEAD